MRILDLESIPGTPIQDYQSSGAASATIGHGSGEAHMHWVRFEAKGRIGPHPTGFAQLLVPIEGEGWAAGPDGQRQELRPGRAAFFSSGEVHSKGSETGMSAVMIQIGSITLEMSGP